MLYNSKKHKGGLFMKNFVRYSGEHIYLSPVRADDEAIRLYTEWMNDESINMWIGKNSSVYTLENERQWAVNQNSDSINFNIVLKSYSPNSLERLIGNCGFVSIKDRNGILGIFIGENFGRDKGYGTEAIKLLIKFGFEELNLHRISLTLNADNHRAYKCYLKAGFTEVGREREAVYYGGHYADVIHMDILKNEYFERKERQEK